MSQQFSSGKNALGICDVCGFTVPFNSLVYQIYDQRNTRVKVCQVCNDDDQPQLQVGRVPIADPQTLMDARPDTGIAGPPQFNSRYLFSWNPAGRNIFPIRVQVGQVTARGS